MRRDFAAEVAASAAAAAADRRRKSRSEHATGPVRPRLSEPQPQQRASTPPPLQMASRFGPAATTVIVTILHTHTRECCTE
jgi:hypothetical protein